MEGATVDSSSVFFKLSRRKIKFLPRECQTRQMTATWPRATNIQGHPSDVVVVEAAGKGQERLTLTPVAGF